MGADDSRRERRDDRYEPMPGMVELPRWAWSRIGRSGRIAALVLLVAAVAAAIPLAASISGSKRERRASEDRARSRFTESEVRRLHAEQRPRFGGSDAAPVDGASPRARLASRVRIMDDLVAAIGADARRRVRAGLLEGPVERVRCEPFPRSVTGRGADTDLSERFGRYSCVAIRSEFKGGVLGHPYRARVDFVSGRYALCKISGRPGPEADPRVTTPKACGG